MFDRQQQVSSSSLKCARCASPAKADVWECPVCYECYGAWMVDPRFASAAIERVLKPTADADEQHRAYCAEAKRRTVAWVREARAA